MKSKPVIRIFASLFSSVCILLLVFSEINAAEPKKPVTTDKFLKPITTDPQSWLCDQVEAGNDVYLSANYLFQVTKLRSQKVLMDYEAKILYPTLMQVMDGMKQMGLRGDALVFVEMGRKLLNPDAEINPAVREEVEKRTAAFNGDPQNKPRGHYTASEELRRYFLGMQFLAKATFDVDVNKRWFANRMYMLFPSDAGARVVKALSAGENRPVLEGLDKIHLFYSRLVGPPDLPSIHDLIASRVAPSRDAVLAYAKKRGIPKINKEMGIGIQCLGERFSLHQFVIESLSQKFLADDPKVNRDKAFRTLQFRNVLLGKTVDKMSVTGLDRMKANVSDPNVSYYRLCLSAVLSLPGLATSPYGLNAAASSMTALAEQTILVTKQTVLEPKSMRLPEEKEKRAVSIYVQPGIEKFLQYLSCAEDNLFSACGMTSAKDYYEILTKSAGTSEPIKSDSPEGVVVLNIVGKLPLDPTVTADVFYFSGRTDKAFLHWAIAPFEVEHTLANGTKVRGMEMAFFEGWHDSARKGTKDPMTNEEWKKLFEQGDFKKFGSVLQIPRGIKDLR